MSEGSGSGEAEDREDGSDEDQFEEAANQIADGAAGQAAQAASALALPEWAADLLARLAAGDRLDARDQPRLQLALDLRREHAAAVQQEKAELASRAQQERAIALKEKENAALLAVIAKQDKTLETLSARVLAVEQGAVEDLEPTFREFCERAKNNPFGGPGVTREGPELEPALRFYPHETAFKYLEEKGGKDFYSFQAFESAAEAIFDVLEKLKVLAPTVVKGVNPQSAEDEADPAYQAEREICKVFNSLNAVYHNVLNSQLSYLQLEAILKKKHGSAADNGWISIFVTNIFSLILGISVAVLALPDGENLGS
eukprot:COSAG05_NODE_381_length_10519_cov_17.942131_2_plen_314_part_00